MNEIHTVSLKIKMFLCGQDFLLIRQKMAVKLELHFHKELKPSSNQSSYN